jgi:hypothetical protein
MAPAAIFLITMHLLEQTLVESDPDPCGYPHHRVATPPVDRQFR